MATLPTLEEIMQQNKTPNPDVKYSDPILSLSPSASIPTSGGTLGVIHLQQHLNKLYPGLNATVEVTRTKNKIKAVKIKYTDPDGIVRTRDVSSMPGLLNGKLVPEDVEDWFGTSDIGKLIVADNNQLEAIADARTKLDNIANLEQQLNSLQGAGSINKIYDLTPEQRAALQLELPDVNEQTILNQLRDPNNILSQMDHKVKPMQSGAYDNTTLAERLNNVNALADIEQQRADATVQSTKDTALNNIVRDAAIYRTLEAQRNKDAAAGTIAGQRAANAQAAAAEAGNAYVEQANTLREALAELAPGLREEYLQNAIDATAADIATKVGIANTEEQNRAAWLQRLEADADLINLALETQRASADRKLTEATARQQALADQYTTNLENQYDADRSVVDSKASTILQDIERAAGGAAVQRLGEGVNVAAPSTTSRFTYTPITSEDKVIDENLLNAVINSNLAGQLLDPSVQAQATKVQTVKDLISNTGLDYLLSKDAVDKQYGGYATEANRRSDRTFNQAQRAYLAAIAAGDAKTTATLTDLARTAGVGKQNLYGTAALSGALNNQQRNSDLGNQLQLAYRKQQADNAAALNTAWDQGRKAYDTQWGGSTDANAITLNSIANMSDLNGAAGDFVYNKLTGAGITGTSSWNDLVSRGVSSNNSTMNTLTNSLNSLDAKRQTNNILNATSLSNARKLLTDSKSSLEDIIKGKVKF